MLALAAIAAAIASLAVASDQDRKNLVPPSIAVDGRGLATIAWTEVGRPGIRIAQESVRSHWSRPVLLDADGGPGSLAVDRKGLAHVAYVGHDGLVVADQFRRGGRGAPAFQPQVVDGRGTGRPAIGITGRGDTVVLYQAEGDGLRVALRGRSGRWRTRRTGISADQPRVATGGNGWTVLAGLKDRGVALAGIGKSGLRRGALGTGGSVVTPRPLRGFDLTIAGGQAQISYVVDELQVVIVARPGEPGNPAEVAATTAGIGSFAAVAGAPTGRSVVLSRNARFRVLSLSVLQGGSRQGDLGVDEGQSGDVAISSDGSQAFVAYWDYPGGRQLYFARVPLDASRVDLESSLLVYQPTLAQASIAPISTPQLTLPRDGKVAIWLAALTLLLTILAGTLLLLGRRRGIRLLPFAIALAVLAGFSVRGAYLAELGVYGLPPNDLLTLDRSGVDAVVDALLIVAVATAILCLVGRLLPVDWGCRALRRLREISLPSRRGAIGAQAVFLAISLAMAAYLLRTKGVETLSKSRQTAFADSGYQLALLYAGAGAWLVLFAASGWPAGRRERALLVAAGSAAFVPLLISGARSAAILGFILPIILLIHLRVRPIRLRTVGVVLASLMVVAIGMRQLTRGEGAPPFQREATPTTESDGAVVNALEPALGWTEAAVLDGFVLVREEYLPRFGTDPFLTPGAFLGIPVPRSLWPDKPRSAMDTFSSRINPSEYGLSKVGQTTTLPGELTMDWGLPGVFVGFAVFALLLCLLGELLAGAGGVFGVLVSAALVPPVAAAIWADSFNGAWGGIVLAVMIGLAMACGRALSGPAPRLSAGGSE